MTRHRSATPARAPRPGSCTRSCPPGWRVADLQRLEMRLLMSSTPALSNLPLDRGGAQDLLFIRVLFSDEAGSPFSGAKDAARLDAQLERTRNAIAATSYGALTLADIDVTPLLTLPGTQDSYSFGTEGARRLRVDALNAAADAGFDIDSYWNDVTWFPRTTFPEDTFEFFGGLANLDTRGIWLNGTIDADVLVHEIGHSLGVLHGGAQDPDDPAVPLPLPGEGQILTYGDPRDVMGDGSAEDGFNARWRAALAGRFFWGRR